jgi:hypothetical protein
MSEQKYKKILEKNGNDKTVKFTIESLKNLIDTLNQYAVSDKLSCFGLKSKIIKEMAELEINLRQIKIILGLTDSLGSGIVKSEIRKKLEAKYHETNRK